MNLIFLVYDSRSGSTVLSREIARHVSDILVTPELRFDTLARWGDARIRAASTEEIVGELLRLRFGDKLEMSVAELRAMIGPGPLLGLRHLLERLGEDLAKRASRPMPQGLIIKHGRHLRVWRKLLMAIPEARFIFAVRDPRAVIQSKLITQRPYHPGETMAWGGILPAALRWCQYSAQARRLSLNASVLDIAYEELLRDSPRTLQAIAQFSGGRAGNGQGWDYRIPVVEQAVHARVRDKGLDQSRMDAWRTELAPDHQIVIETVCRAEMRRRGYTAELAPGLARRLGALGTAVLESLALVSRSALRRISQRARRLAA